MNKLTDKWICVDEELPEDRTYVLVIHNLGTWIDDDDPKRVNVVVVKFVKGITLTEREQMSECTRKRLFMACDEHGNNLKPYCWDQFGPHKFFGQQVTYWKPITMPNN